MYRCRGIHLSGYCVRLAVFESNVKTGSMTLTNKIKLSFGLMYPVVLSRQFTSCNKDESICMRVVDQSSDDESNSFSRILLCSVAVDSDCQQHAWTRT